MDRIRRSIRQSFRRKRSPEPAELVNGSGPNGAVGKNEQWQGDDAIVRDGRCCFNVKYLGAVEVFESRGMQVCEGALKNLRNNRRRPVKAVLYVSGDGLRVVDQQNNRGLIVDQTIEKVSFCAPDRMNDKGFAYICRDGTSRRWMCHGFNASKDSGERLSHAVGCAFAICLERKKKRDDESGESQTVRDNLPPVSVEKALNPDWDTKDYSIDQPSTLQRSNQAYQSFRKQISIGERLQDPQSVIVNTVASSSYAPINSSIAKPRPSSNPSLFQRQGSLRAPDVSNTSEFRRNHSMRSTSLHSDIDPKRRVYGQSLFNEPIFESEETMTSSATAPSSTSHSRLAGGDNFGTGHAPSTSSCYPSLAGLQNTNMPSPGLAQWNTFDSSGRSLTNGGRGGGVSTDQLININTESPLSPIPPAPSSRSKADEWLADALRTSISMTSPPPTAAPITPAPASLPINGWGAPRGSLMDSPVSGPPPSHPPPPLPLRNAVVNTALHRPSATPSPSMDVFGQAVQWEPLAPPPRRPDDPFDVQWSRRAVANSNPFNGEGQREVSI